MPKTMTESFFDSVETRHDRAIQRQRAAARRVAARRVAAKRTA